MRIGYGRVSTRDQNPSAQRDALAAAGCDEVFVDKASGKLARRPELDKALLSANRAGDQLVVTKLDRLGRSLEHLISLAKALQGRGVDLQVLDQGIDTSTAVGRMFFQILGAIAEFEHALMSERTMDGLAAARARGRTGGQQPKLTPARPASPSRCTTRPAQRASAATPWRRSPPNSASPAQPSTGTSNAWRQPNAPETRAHDRRIMSPGCSLVSKLPQTWHDGCSRIAPDRSLAAYLP
jgi:Resolvase, N terminal domain